MATRKIREIGEDCLRAICKEVTEINPRMEQLIDDMFDTMYEANGVGLAAPQVGVRKRIAVVDVTGEDPLVLINPKIIEASGEQTGQEGCLPVPGKCGQVTRANKITVLNYDADMTPYEFEAEEFLARAIQHEMDHLDGKMYVDIVEGPLLDTETDDEE